MLDSTSIQHHVLIVGDGSLFDAGVTKFLTCGTSLSVSHIVYSAADAFLNMIKCEQPDVILVCDSGLLDTNQIINSVITDALMIGLCIFVMRLGDFKIDVYEHPSRITDLQPYRQRTILFRTGNELINILKRKHYAPSPTWGRQISPG